MVKVPRYTQSVDDLLAEMDHCGIAQAVVSHVLSRFSKPEIGNKLTVAAIAQSERLIGCFILLPGITDEMKDTEKYVVGMLTSGMRAARIFPAQHSFSISSEPADRMFNVLQDYRVPLHVWSREVPWEILDQLAAKYPELSIIVEQCEEETFRNIRKLYPIFEKRRNLFLEVHHSHLYLMLDVMVKKFGGERFVYSSYYPADDPLASLMLVTQGNFSDEDKRLIAGGNYRKLIGGVRI
jgi:predicted TIM-barrel fold metal-dependent hydrolase